MKPGFFIIGAARSGTTSIYAYLDQHPEVFFSEVKEINFFSNPKIWQKGFGWYESHFKNARHEKIAGEASTSYTASPFLNKAPQRLADYRPDAKLIYIVRDPVDRMISHYMHRVHRGVENRPFSDLIADLDAEPTAWQGRYWYQLQQYLEVFDRDQILVLSFDELRDSAELMTSKIFRFLGVDSDINAKGSEKVYNASSGTLRKSDFGIRVLRFYRRYVEQKRLPYAFKKWFLKLANVNAVKHDRPVLSAHDRQILTAFFEADSKALSRDFGINVSGWLRQ